MKKTIICFGDSNTHGYCSETGGRFDDTKRYPCLLEKYLGEGYIVREEGLSGRTTVFEDPLFEGLCGLSAIFGADDVVSGLRVPAGTPSPLFADTPSLHCARNLVLRAC